MATNSAQLWFTGVATLIAVASDSLPLKSQQIFPSQSHVQIGQCTCPDDKARDGTYCGRRSAYCRCNGSEPLCYSGDDSGQRDANRRQHCGHGC